MANYRGGRINEEARREISVIIRDEIKGPRMIAMVSITAVKVTKDLRYAKVFVSIFGRNEDEKNETFAVLKSVSGYIRKEIGQRISLRNTPQVLFEPDDSISYSVKIEELIERAKGK